MIKLATDPHWSVWLQLVFNWVDENWKPYLDIDESEEPSDINTENKINMRRSYAAGV